MTPSERLKAAASAGEIPSLQQLLLGSPQGPIIAAAGITAHLGRQRWDARVRGELEALAAHCGFTDERARLFAGERINTTENRAVLHPALRASDESLRSWEGRPEARAQRSGEDRSAVAELVRTTRARMQTLAEDLQTGRLRGYTGQRITDIVNIGIGGSHLGPELIVDALAGRTGRAHAATPRVHFLSNIDGHSLAGVLGQLQPERTLFLVVSKSFSTLETALNAEAVRSWFLERTGSLAAIGDHFVAVSNNTAAAAAFGLPPERVLPMGDWVGGRYSLWSAAGLCIALGLGWETFSALLAGAEAMDEHFQRAPEADNLPLQMALSEWLNVNVYGCDSHAVLCYDDRLRLLPDYLQQLEMESNGKRTDRQGAPVTDRTQPVLWGGVGTNGQHAFHQLLHQGTEAYFADFILCRRADHDYPAMHRWLQANALAQGQGMAAGQTHEDPHRAVPGNHPSATLVLDALRPDTLGALLAAYEHKVFCLGILWNINSFDQWGVELGKALARPLAAALENGASGAAPSTAPQDGATQALIASLCQGNSDSK